MPKMSAEEDPIALIESTKGVTHNFRDQRCAIRSPWHAHEQLFMCVYREEEDIKDCCDGHKNIAEMIENDNGKLGIEDDSWKNDEVCKNSSKADQDLDENTQAAQVRTREKFLVCGLLAGCDEKRFGNLTKDLENDCTFGDNEFPVAMQKAHECLMNHEKHKPKNNQNNNGELGIKSNLWKNDEVCEKFIQS